MHFYVTIDLSPNYYRLVRRVTSIEITPEHVEIDNSICFLFSMFIVQEQEEEEEEEDEEEESINNAKIYRKRCTACRGIFLFPFSSKQYFICLSISCSVERANSIRVSMCAEVDGGIG